MTSGKRYPIFSLFVYFILGLFLANFFGYITGLAFCGFEKETVENLLLNPQNYPSRRGTLMLIQAVSSMCSFIAIPILYLIWYEKRSFFSILSSLKSESINVPILLFLGIIFISITYLPFNTYIAHLNDQISFPSRLKFLESFIKRADLQIEKMVLFLLDFSSLKEFILGLFVIAIIPALGEEFFFRRILLTRLIRSFKDIHLAVWISSCLFSAFHFQFYGFIPRILLGSIFGYLYVWSSMFWLPVFAHFFNNAFLLCLLYFSNEDMDTLTSQIQEKTNLTIAFSSLICTILLMLLFKRYFLFGKLPDNKRWEKVFTTKKVLQAKIVKDILQQYQIRAVIVNKLDSSFNDFGEREILVPKSRVTEAVSIINDEITFE